MSGPAPQHSARYPRCETVVAERFFDEAGGMQLVMHAPFGSRINRAWGLALRKRFCRTFNFELQAAATDNGIVISLDRPAAFPLELVFEFLKSETVRDVLTQALLDAPMFGRAGAGTRHGRSQSCGSAAGRKFLRRIQRMRSDDLLASVFPDQVALCREPHRRPIRIPDHPLVNETIANCLDEAMDLAGTRAGSARNRDRRDSHGRHRYARAVAVQPRDSQRKPVCVPR